MRGFPLTMWMPPQVKHSTPGTIETTRRTSGCEEPGSPGGGGADCGVERMFSQADGRRGLARSPAAERTCGHVATHRPDTRLALDRFEAAVAFAIEEAERRGPSRRSVVTWFPADDR